MPIKYGFLKKDLLRQLSILISLSIALFIYFFYRTDHTLINKIYIAMMGHEQYINLKGLLQHNLHLNNWVIYSLPGGLWVFAATIVSKRYNIQINDYKINLRFIPLIIVLCIEIAQFFHWNPGVFDSLDIFLGWVGWLGGIYFFKSYKNSCQRISIINMKSWFCIMTNAIVYLAHV
ncbi:MAG: hypothetical protein ORN85_03860, partial [Sediminibacterium sp.]|nr:hypothetical protein [Sediminibacterium sp.]